VSGPLGHRTFRFLLAGRGVSMLGTAIAPVAIAFAVLDLTGSPAALGIVLAARSIPQVALMLIGGVISDRFDRSRVLVVANLVAGAAQAAAAVLLLTGSASIPTLAILEAVNGAASALVFPAAAAITPQTVPASMLQQANATLRLVLNAAVIAGASAGGLLVAYVGPGWGLVVDAVAYTVAAAMFARITLRDTGVTSDRVAVEAATGTAEAVAAQVSVLRGVWADLQVGWREVTSRTWLWSVVLAFSFANAAQAAGWHTLGPVVADRTFGPSGWGFVLAAQTAGMFAGALVLLRFRPRRPLFFGCAAILLWVPMLVVLAVEPRLTLLLPVAFVAGLGFEAFGVFWDLSLQQRVPSDRLARVYSFDAVGSYAMIPIGQLAAGPLAALAGVPAGVFASAMVITAAITASLFVPSVRRLERTDITPAAR
jgi:predicted MFS family arabinose efflux permease